MGDEPADLLADLRSRGIRVEVHGDGSLVVGPSERLTERDLEGLRRHRAAIRALLEHEVGSSPRCPGCSRMDYLPLDGGWRRCWACGRRWGPVGSVDPGDPPDLARLQLLLGLGAPTTARASTSPAMVKPGEQHPEVRVRQVETADELELALADVLAAERPLVALDLETYGEAARADWRLRDRPGLDPFAATIRLATFTAPHRDRLYVVDLARVGDPRRLQPLLDHAVLVGHNLKFELRMLHAAGLRLPDDLGYRLSDTMLASQVLLAGRREDHSLKAVVARHLGLQLDKAAQTSDWSGRLTEEQIRYAAEDVAHLLPLLEVLQHELAAAGLTETFHLECRALPAVAWLETSGVGIDAERWRALATEAEQRRQALEAELQARLGRRPEALALPLEGLEASPVCWNSPEQVLTVLRERGVEVLSTREAALAAHLGRDPLVPLLLEHRKVAKLASTYGLGYLGHLHPITGRLHPDWFQLGSEAGRMSCRSPNLQQIPRTSRHRACVVAPEGRVLVKADYSQIELRIAAEISGDQRLIETYRQGGDVHTLTARQVLGGHQVTGADRQKAKALNFGLIYGMGADRLRRYARTEYGVEMSLEQANAYRERFFVTYPGLRVWHRRQPNHPIATRTLGGRRRLGVEQFTQKLNSPVQGTGADLLKEAMARLYQTRRQVPSARLVLAVHDELVVEVAERHLELATAWLERCLREAGEVFLRQVPVEVEVKAGRTWAG